jgi:DNA-binding response OmpR family regulator
LRNADATAKLPILMLSVKAKESDKSMGLKVGANEFLGKPISPDELAAGAGKLLGHDGDAPREEGQDSSERLKFWPHSENKGE